MDGRATVVVGVDGSPASRAALRYAVEDAARRGGRVQAIQVFVPVEYWAREWGVSARQVTADVEASLLRRLRADVDEVRGARPGLVGVPVEVRALPGSTADVLVGRSRTADLLVVGHRGHGAVASAMLGSVALRCVLTAACPVTVVPSVAAERGRVAGRSSVVRRVDEPAAATS